VAYADSFSRDPAANSSPPPLGAPQGGLPVKRISSTFRTAMAAIAECWGGAADGSPGVKNLRGMAAQDPANVDIKGGKIGAGVVIEGGTTLVWGLSRSSSTTRSIRSAMCAGSPRARPSSSRRSSPRRGSSSRTGFVAVTGTLANAGTTQAGGWDTTDNGAIVNLDRHHRRHRPDHGRRCPPASPWTSPRPPRRPRANQAEFRHPAEHQTLKNTGGGRRTRTPSPWPGASAHHHTLTPPQLYLAAWKRVS
jgi:hypothetical protein